MSRRLASILLVLASAGAVRAAEPAIEGSPFRGRELLTQKLCTQCHSVWGHGGLQGPELSTAVAGKNWLDLVGDFWNHTPRMIDAMAARGHKWPTLDRKEMADLLSYLYYLRLFDEPGDAGQGFVSWTRLGCSTCHSLAGGGGARGGALDQFSTYPSPVILAQAMWNAGPTMQRDQIGRGSAIPNFSKDEMADLQAYIRARGLRGDRQVELLPLPDPLRGAAVFESKRCAACHRRLGGGGPDLGSLALRLTVSEISGTLWNHSYAMGDMMRARGIPFPRFEGTEMADLISYLYFLGFLGEHGEPGRGASVFKERGCTSCHGGGGKAVSLTGSKAASDPIALSAAMWNHAPEMHDLMAERGVAWPTFDPGDMEDLAAYLRKAASPAERTDKSR
jgi:mono/diheme cytochrome c family protein